MVGIRLIGQTSTASSLLNLIIGVKQTIGIFSLGGGEVWVKKKSKSGMGWREGSLSPERIKLG